MATRIRVIEAAKHQRCNRCGKTKECRDVFDTGKPICFACTKPAELRSYGQRLFGPSSRLRP